MTRPPASPASAAIFALPDFRFLLASSLFSTLAGRALAVVIGYQVYALTKSPLALGWLGLAEAIPAVSLALFGGHVADRHDRRRTVLITQGVSILCALAFAWLSLRSSWGGVLALYGVVFVAGVARGFADPAASAFEAQVVPREVMVRASSWLSSVWQASSIVGPALGGLAFASLHAAGTYVMVAALFALSWLCIWRTQPRPLPPQEDEGESIWRSIAGGVRYVFRNQVLVGSMALDLFAVLFGGAIALLPVFATDILHVGPRGLGLLVAAPSVGALLVTLWATRYPPGARAGQTLLWCVAGFGICMIVFALSRSFWLSLAALALSGAFDGVSMVIRRAILRLRSPEHLRGRVAAVSSIFIGSSNEIGAFESGMAAAVLGTVRSVWLGGLITLMVVGGAAALAPELRQLDLGAGERPAEN